MKKVFAFFPQLCSCFTFLVGYQKKKKITNPQLKENYLNTVINNKSKYRNIVYSTLFIVRRIHEIL